MREKAAKSEGAGAFPIWKSIIGRYSNREWTKRPPNRRARVHNRRARVHLLVQLRLTFPALVLSSTAFLSFCLWVICLVLPRRLSIYKILGLISCVWSLGFDRLCVISWVWSPGLTSVVGLQALISCSFPACLALVSSDRGSCVIIKRDRNA